MNVQYEAVIDELSDTDADSFDRSDNFFMRYSHARVQKWPQIIGTLQIVAGFIIVFLSTLEVLILPIIESKYYQHDIRYDKSHCYGTGFLAGFAIILSGSTAVRTSFSRRKSTVYRFYILSLFTLLLCLSVAIFFFVGYYKGWTSSTAYPADSSISLIHLLVLIFIFFGSLSVLMAIIQYYEIVCCDHLKLWEQCISCIVWCVFRRWLIKVRQTGDIM